ncbi:DUF3899 domain-containing protein [Acetivibrio ethanolgignens]|uniref:Uncharacterized protein n=1 Tax=Acetivibrio ethanolgignens TaxID=290052 RepID=A0A0V8QE91_9FIRM|nr:DUF3899 domain-containing protein [Acetivibrio ethanolgignens]KSV58895.1 hypothetical protein ASU35_11115 [Acetivibrio ethanolgignens]
MKRRGKGIRYMTAAGIGLSMLLLIVWEQELWNAKSSKEIYKILCDAFTVPGLLFLMLGFLLILSRQGIFHGVSYLMGGAVSQLLPFLGKPRESYGAYLERKRKKKEEPMWEYQVLFVTGGIFFAGALLLLYLYCNT